MIVKIAVYFSFSPGGGEAKNTSANISVRINGTTYWINSQRNFSARRGIFCLQSTLAKPQKTLFGHTGMFSNLFKNQLYWLEIAQVSVEAEMSAVGAQIFGIC